MVVSPTIQYMWLNLLSVSHGKNMVLVIPCLALVLVVVSWLWHLYTRSHPTDRKPLRGPRGWPIVGNLFQLGAQPHRTLLSWSRAYGDVYKVRFGSWDCVVVNGLGMIRQALLKQGAHFAGRPDFPSYRHYANGLSISFGTYGSTLKAHRQFTASAIRQVMTHPQHPLEEIVQRENQKLIEMWLSKGEDSVITDPRGDLTLAISSVLYSVCYGRECCLKDDPDFKKLLINDNPSSVLFSVANQVDFLPWLFRLTSYSNFQQYIERNESFLQMNNMKASKKQSEDHSADSTCVMQSLLNTFKRKLGQAGAGSLSPERVQNTTIEILSAGSDTSSTLISWFLLYMIEYPDVQVKVQEEIDAVIGRDVTPRHVDKLKLPYTEAVLLEVMRLTTIVPLALPHYTTSSTTLDGYHIPKDTVVFVNLWSAGRDPCAWDDPDSFFPERFLSGNAASNDIEVDRSMTENLLPFGAGKRRCIGEILGRMQVFVFCSSLLQKCCFAKVEGDHLNFTPIFGDILKPQPFSVRISHRL